MYIDSFTGKKSSRFLKRVMVIAGIVVDNDFIEISNLKDIEKIYEAHKDDEYIMFKVLSQNSVDFVLAKKIDRSLESLED